MKLCYGTIDLDPGRLEGAHVERRFAKTDVLDVGDVGVLLPLEDGVDLLERLALGLDPVVCLAGVC